jgi:hypothetical protein
MLITNTDMVFDDQTEDLKLDDYGALSFTASADTPPNAVIRRLGTPPEGYARMVRIGTESKVYNDNYSSLLPLMLSTPGLDSFDVQSAVELASSQDGRVTPVDFAVNQDGGSVNSFTLSYLTTDNDVQTITASI